VLTQCSRIDPSALCELCGRTQIFSFVWLCLLHTYISLSFVCLFRLHFVFSCSLFAHEQRFFVAHRHSVLQETEISLIPNRPTLKHVVLSRKRKDKYNILTEGVCSNVGTSVRQNVSVQYAVSWKIYLFILVYFFSCSFFLHFLFVSYFLLCIRLAFLPLFSYFIPVFIDLRLSFTIASSHLSILHTFHSSGELQEEQCWTQLMNIEL